VWPPHRAESLARRILELNDEIAMLDDLIKPLVGELAPRLLQATGIGVEIAATCWLPPATIPAWSPASRAS